MTSACGEAGNEIGAEVSRRCGDAAPAELVECLVDLPEERGYEPYDDEGMIRLRNCPFDKLASEHRDLVCGMNLSIMEGATDALGTKTIRPRLDPRSDSAACRSSTRARARAVMRHSDLRAVTQR